VRSSEKTGGSDDVSQATADHARSVAQPDTLNPPNPFDILDRPRHEPPGGDSDEGGDDFGRPRRAIWLGVDTPLRVGHG
jgi:hypothetical protein